MKRILERLTGHRTYILAVALAVVYSVRLFLLDDQAAAMVMEGFSFGALLAGFGALLGGSKYGGAKLKEADKMPGVGI